MVVEAEGSPRKLLSRDFEGIPIGVGLLSLSRVRASSFSRSFKLRYFAEVDETRDTIIAQIQNYCSIILRRDFFIFFDLIFFRNPSRFFSLSFYTSSFVGNRCTVIICLEEEVERWTAGPTIVQISSNGIVISCVISRSKTNLATELRNQNSSCISRRPGLTKWLSGHARLKPVTCSLVAPVAWPPLEHENSTRCIG